jgi:hypothetical protein
MDGNRDFKDDLESSIYVLLWMTLMNSECSNRSHVASFLALVLDPQPHGSSDGGIRADFLQGMSFLKSVKFPD